MCVMDLDARKKEVEAANAAARKVKEDRFQSFAQQDFSGIENVDVLFASVIELGSDEVRKLTEVNPSFKAKLDEFNRVKTPAELDQEKAAADSQAAAEAAAQAE